MEVEQYRNLNIADKQAYTHLLQGGFASQQPLLPFVMGGLQSSTQEQSESYNTIKGNALGQYVIDHGIESTDGSREVFFWTRKEFEENSSKDQSASNYHIPHFKMENLGKDEERVRHLLHDPRIKRDGYEGLVQTIKRMVTDDTEGWMSFQTIVHHVTMSYKGTGMVVDTSG